MSSRGNVMACLRVLLLPMRATREVNCARIVGKYLGQLQLSHHDFLTWIHLRIDEWRETGSANYDLQQLVCTILLNADDKLGSLLASKYFIVHGELQKNHFMSHDEARALLSTTFLMADLARIEHLSGAQISRLLTGRGYGLQFSRQSVNDVIGALGLGCMLSVEKLKTLYLSDSSNELAYFSDSDIGLAASTVESAAHRLGFNKSLKDALTTLAPAEELSRYSPYLQILHYQCSIAEYYDHAVTDMYEFSPRGIAALWLFGQYPDILSQAGNPFLNNAKSVEAIDSSWVRSKKLRDRPGAKALFEVLDGLNDMQFAPRRELAKILRLWLHRIMRLTAPYSVNIPENFTQTEIANLLQGIAKGNSKTFGVLEQRIIDVLAAVEHPQSDGWRSRGLGDSVNTTNVSKRKVGDCDFQHADSRLIVAYEAHGGELTDVYVHEHLRTISKSLKSRNQELEGIADLADWTIEVVFVAHRLAVSSLFETTLIEGIRINLEFITFKDFISSAHPDIAEWEKNFLTPIRETRTPNEVRLTLLKLSECA